MTYAPATLIADHRNPQRTPAGSTSPGPGVTLHVAVDRGQARSLGTSVVEIAEILQELTRDLVPDAHIDVSITVDQPSGLSVDLAARRVLVDGVDIELTPREFKLLAFLYRFEAA